MPPKSKTKVVHHLIDEPEVGADLHKPNELGDSPTLVRTRFPWNMHVPRPILKQNKTPVGSAACPTVARPWPSVSPNRLSTPNQSHGQRGFRSPTIVSVSCKNIEMVANNFDIVMDSL